MCDLYDNMQLSVRDVDENVFREFKARAVKEKFNVGKALTLAMKNWAEKRTPKKNFLALKPTDWGEGTENISQEIDKVLYR